MPGERTPPADDAQPSFPPRPFDRIAGDYDEIDTTPTLDDAPPRDLPRRADLDAGPISDDEIDTTPRDDTPEPREAEARAEVMSEGELDEIDTTPRPDTTSSGPVEDDPDRPKRSGWWQRKSFFG